MTGRGRGPRLSGEPFSWLGFSAGGVLAALLIPALLFLFGLAFPLGWLDPPAYAGLLELLRHPLTRLVLFGVCALSLIHFAHRFRFLLIDGLRLRRTGGGGTTDVLITGGAFGLAAVGTAVAGWIFAFAL